MPISQEDAERIARAQTNESGRLFRSGCGIVLAMLLIGTLVLWLLMLRA